MCQYDFAGFVVYLNRESVFSANLQKNSIKKKKPPNNKITKKNNPNKMRRNTCDAECKHVGGGR